MTLSPSLSTKSTVNLLSLLKSFLAAYVNLQSKCLVRNQLAPQQTWSSPFGHLRQDNPVVISSTQISKERNEKMGNENVAEPPDLSLEEQAGHRPARSLASNTEDFETNATLDGLHSSCPRGINL